MYYFFTLVFVLSVTTDVVRARARPYPAGMSLYKTSASWEDADRTCRTEGAVLASPINEAALEAIMSLMGAHNTTYYIGIRSAHFKGPFVSVEGIPLRNLSLSVMDMIDTIEQRNGDCLAMNRDSIRVVPCWSRLPFMCYDTHYYNMADNHLDNPSPPLVITFSQITPQQSENNLVNNMNCGPVEQGYNYDSSQNSCYKIHTEKKPWKEAEQTCVAEGAHLVVLDNESEADTVRAMLEDLPWRMTWTGLSHHIDSDGWISVHGNRVEDLFNNWYDNIRPTDIYQCSIFDNNVLGWRACRDSSPIVCEKIPISY